MLLDRCLRNQSPQEEDLLEDLIARGVKLSGGVGKLGMTVFHELALSGAVERFATLSEGRGFKLPQDDWGRAPSDIAAPTHAEAIAKLEAEHFRGKAPKWQHAKDQPPYLVLEHAEGPKLSAAQRQKVIRLLRKIPELKGFDARKTRTVAYKSPFYRATSLIVATNPDWQAGRLQVCFLQRGSEFVALRGTSPPIHEFNAKFKTRITPKHASTYLAFFCFFVRGEEGPFLIVDRAANRYVPARLQNSKAIGACPRVRLWGTDERGYVRASAPVFYSNALFAADFLIHPAGMVEMVDDLQLATDLEERVDAPIDPSK